MLSLETRSRLETVSRPDFRLQVLVLVLPADVLVLVLVLRVQVLVLVLLPQVLVLILVLLPQVLVLILVLKEKVLINIPADFVQKGLTNCNVSNKRSSKSSVQDNGVQKSVNCPKKTLQKKT